MRSYLTQQKCLLPMLLRRKQRNPSIESIRVMCMSTTNSNELLTAAQALVSAAVSQSKGISKSLEKDQATSLGEIWTSLEGLNRSSSEDLSEIKQKLSAIEAAIQAQPDLLRIQFAIFDKDRTHDFDYFDYIEDENTKCNAKPLMDDILKSFLNGRGCHIPENAFCRDTIWNNYHDDGSKNEKEAFRTRLKTKLKALAGGEPRITIVNGKPVIYYR